MTKHSEQPSPQKRPRVGTTRGLMLVIVGAAIACFLLVQIRGCRFGRRSMHGPSYTWHRYLSSVEDRALFEQQAAAAEEKAAKEKELAAEASDPAEREEHEARAESWEEEASHYRFDAATAVQSARRHLKNYQESHRGAKASRRSP